MADPTYPALAAHLDAATTSVHTSDQIANQSSATGDSVTDALNHIHNTRPTADNTLVSGEILIGAGDGHLEASGVLLSSLPTGSYTTAASAATLSVEGLADTISVTGTTTISSLGAASRSGIRRMLVFQENLTMLTTNGTSTILLPAAQSSVSFRSGDCAEFVSIGADAWACVSTSSRAALGVGMVKLAEGAFTTGTTFNISVPSLSGYKYFKLVCRNMQHTHTAATRIRVRLFNGVTAQSVRFNTTAVTDWTANATYGETLNGQNADMVLEGDFAGTYRRGLKIWYSTHQTATTTNFPAEAPFGTVAGYNSRLESSLAIDTIQISWLLGNVGGSGDYILYGYN